MAKVRIVVWDKTLRFTLEDKTEREAVIATERVLRDLKMGRDSPFFFWVDMADCEAKVRVAGYFLLLTRELEAERQLEALLQEPPQSLG